MSASEPPVKKQNLWKGCLLGCAASLVLSVILLALSLYGGLKMIQKYDLASLVAKEPMLLPAPASLDEQQTKTVEQFEGLVFGDNTGEGENLVVLSGEELTALARRYLQSQELSGDVRVEVLENSLRTQASISTDVLGPFAAVAGISGQYLNVESALRVHVANGQMELAVDSILVNGMPLPEELMREFQGDSLTRQAQADPAIQEALKQVELLEIKDGKVTLRMKPQVK